MDASCCIQRNIHVLNSIQINVCPEYWVHIKIGDFMKGSTMKTYKVLTINPGSTSTKIALFENATCLYSKNVAHDASELAKYNKISDQLPYRRNMILDLLEEADISLEDVDVFVLVEFCASDGFDAFRKSLKDFDLLNDQIKNILSDVLLVNDGSYIEFLAKIWKVPERETKKLLGNYACLQKRLGLRIEDGSNKEIKT